VKLTKYEHACLVLEDNGAKVVIDPGVFTKEFGNLDAIVAVVVTHVHGDHYAPKHLDAILEANPDALIFTTRDVADEYKHDNVQVVSDGDHIAIETFTLQFVGEDHTVIHDSLPTPLNTGVLINEQFYYPGDSFTLPGKPIKILAVPANAPWATVGQSMDFISEGAPELCFPTHNGLLSETGHLVYNDSLNHICQQADIEFKALQPGESLDV